ncbi:MAG: hypothetical protein RIT26_202 [Pseudomonadota bacterium]|jgi:glycosyltransferase involved in cell wall biosynthesis
MNAVVSTSPSAGLVSVVMPAHDAAATLNDSIASVSTQSCTNWELWVVNDGSSDATAAVLNDWARRDARVKVLTLVTKSGPGAARNLALDQAQGEYIAFLDADDVWLPDKLRLQRQAMDAQTLDLSYGDHIRFYADAKRGPLRVQAIDWVDLARLHQRNWILLSSAMLRRSRLGDLRFKTVPHEDYVYWHAALSRIDRAYRVAPGVALVQYRVWARSRSGQKLRSAWQHWTLLRTEFGLSWPQAIRGFACYAHHGLVRTLRAWSTPRTGTRHENPQEG